MAWTVAVEERFKRYVSPEPTSGCWLWTGATLRKGYGNFTPKSKVSRSAHRMAWELWRGPIPAGACVLHKCDVTCCVNPEHLWLGSKGDNNRDRHRKGRTVMASFRRVTDAQVDEIKLRFGNGEHAEKIAADLNICSKTVRRVFHGKVSYAVGR